MNQGLRAAALAMSVAGLLLAGTMVIGLAGGPSSFWAFAAAMLLAGLSLPALIRRRGIPASGLANAGTVLVLAGLVLVALFNLQLLLLLADWVNSTVETSTMGAGRQAALALLGGGLLLLGAGWGSAADDIPVRAALVLVGAAGLVLAWLPQGRAQGAWYLALGALWTLVGLAALLDARGSVRT